VTVEVLLSEWAVVIVEAEVLVCTWDSKSVLAECDKFREDAILWIGKCVGEVEELLDSMPEVDCSSTCRSPAKRGNGQKAEGYGTRTLTLSPTACG
jgi:hypothetical protein